MYSYHNRILQRIRNNELSGHRYIKNSGKDDDHGLVLEFDTEPKTRPIKNKKINDYIKYL